MATPRRHSPSMTWPDTITVEDAGLAIPTLLNTDASPHAPTIIARCCAFAEATPTPALIVTLLPSAPAGLEHFAAHEAAATLWAFTRQAAIAWAPRDIRVNALVIGTPPIGPEEADEMAGRATAPIRAVAAERQDLLATLRLMAELPSLTGQIIRLGMPAEPAQ